SIAASRLPSSCLRIRSGGRKTRPPWPAATMGGGWARPLPTLCRRGPAPTPPAPLPGSQLVGNPGNGEMLFDPFPSDAGQPCAACHARPFGTAGGKRGGGGPREPTSPDTTALFNGAPDGSPHSDLEIPHLRNMYVKFGPVFGPPGTSSPP